MPVAAVADAVAFSPAFGMLNTGVVWVPEYLANVARFLGMVI